MSVLRCVIALSFHCVLVTGTVSAQLKDARVADYEQWRLAQKAGTVADPKTVTTLPGFQIKLIHVARPNEGSWISLAFDPRGRIVIGREDKGLLRLTLAADRRTVSQVETIDETLLECRGLLFAHDSLYVHANNSKGLYRLRDTDGDDQFDEVRLLRKTEGGVGHGRNGLALGPDGKIYMAMGNNVKVATDCDATSPYRNYANERLLPCVWNEFLFDSDVVPPCGHIVRTDAEGQTWEMFAGGFRNPYDLDFNADGELFTYDADMEWDAGAPWYRPTCVMHVVSGGEYGWRQETNCWPEHYADSLPRVVDIGLGSPTGVKFGTRSNFPGKYKSACFVLDWSYGRIIAVHPVPRGATYTGSAETFIKGRPLNVTDLEFGPEGAMYFVVGGRRTQSALYRVTFQGEPATATPATATPTTADEHSASDARAVRQSLAKYQGSQHPDAIKIAWPHLKSADPWIRQAARLVVERQPVETWQELALAENAKNDSIAAATALIALARSGTVDLRPRVFARLAELAAGPVGYEERMLIWRAMQLTILRMGPPDPDRRREITEILGRFYHPLASARECEMLCELLVALEATDVVGLTLAILDATSASSSDANRTQEEQLFSIFALRHVEQGWTDPLRERYFQWIKRAESFQGAQYLQRFLTFIRTDALGALSEEQRVRLAPIIGKLGKTPTVLVGKTTVRPEVRKWTLDELAGSLEMVGEKRDLARGRQMFAEAQCSRCHRKNGAGQPIGPDLDGVASRFGRRDLLETIVAPSKVVEEKYRNLVLETENGKVFTGQLAGGDATMLVVATDPLEPTLLHRIPRNSIVARTTSPISIMPEGLLNSLSLNEILDLLAYLEAIPATR